MINANAPTADEDFITKSFHVVLAKRLREANNENYIARMFLKDLEDGFPKINHSDLVNVATGLLGEVILHKKETEKITGGDLGLLIIRPQITYSFERLQIADYRRGLLAQAKLKRPNGKWNVFKPNQKKILPQRLSYLALLLYQYSDTERRLLNPFLWQLCSNLSFKAVETCLKRGKFPQVLESRDIIHRLAGGLVGTDDNGIIDKYISTAKNPCLTIRIWWPDDKRPPGSTVWVSVKSPSVSRQSIKLGH